MKRTALTLSALALALSSCDNTYTNWELPNVIRKNQPVVAPAPKPARSAQVQPEFKKPAPQPVQAARYTPRPVMTPAQKEQVPVMPGQNRALKRRR